MITSEDKRNKRFSEVTEMNKMRNWVREHKEESVDAACLVGFAAVVLAFFFGRDIAIAISGVGALLAIGANLTA